MSNLAGIVQAQAARAGQAGTVPACPPGDRLGGWQTP